MDILSRFHQVKAFIFDVDGVLTDGSLLVLENGALARTTNVKDGYAIQLAVKLGYKIIIISGAAESSVKIRMNGLGVKDVYFGIKDKKTFVSSLLSKYELQKDEVLYMGDDIPDLPVFTIVDLSCCPADAVTDVRSAAAFVSTKSGGKGCVREVIEKVVRSKGQWNLDSGVASTF